MISLISLVFVQFLYKVLALLLTIFLILCFPGSSGDKEPACSAGDLGSIPGSGRSHGGRHGNPLQHSCLENPHGQKNLAGYSPQGRRVRHNSATKHTHVPYTIQYIFVINSFYNWKFILLNPI